MDHGLYNGVGTSLTPRFYEGPSDATEDLRIRQKFFTFQIDSGLVSGKSLTVTFTVRKPARAVWPHVKDLNPWQNSYQHYYSGVIGDLEGKTFHLSKSAEGLPLYRYRVERVIPEHLIVISQLVSDEERGTGRSADYHVFLLDEFEGATTVTFLMEHSSLSNGLSESEALTPWRVMAEDSQMKWRDIFIPNLRRLIDGEGYSNDVVHGHVR